MFTDAGDYWQGFEGCHLLQFPTSSLLLGQLRHDNLGLQAPGTKLLHHTFPTIMGLTHELEEIFLFIIPLVTHVVTAKRKLVDIFGNDSPILKKTPN